MITANERRTHMKKNVTKGFTLVEVLIAMAVLGIMTLMLSVCYTAVCTTNLRSSQMNDRVDLMVPYAEERSDLDDAGRYTSGTADMKVVNKTTSTEYTDCVKKIAVSTNPDGTINYEADEANKAKMELKTYQVWAGQYSADAESGYVFYPGGGDQDKADYADGNFNFFKPSEDLWDYSNDQ